MQRYITFFITVNALHVSGGSSAHHQELKTVHTASGICQACLLLPHLLCISLVILKNTLTMHNHVNIKYRKYVTTRDWEDELMNIQRFRRMSGLILICHGILRGRIDWLTTIGAITSLAAW